MPYQWIIFDADETLFRFDAFRGLQTLFADFGVHFTEQHYQDYQAVNQPLWQAYQDGQISARELQHRRFAHWGAQLDISPGILNSAFIQTMADICQPLPGAHELLNALKGRVQMAIITNGFTELQQTRLERTGLATHFDALVISEQVGVAKPDKAIFDHALAAMGEPERRRVLMVGDNPHADIKGGQNAGLQTCWLNADGAPRPEGVKPDHEVASLSQLQALLFSQDKIPTPG